MIITDSKMSWSPWCVLFIMTLSPFICHGAKDRNWQVKVTTSGYADASTKSHNLIRIIGTLGNSEFTRLDIPHHRDFKSGAMDTYNIKTKNVGIPKAIQILFEPSGRSPDWHLQKIEMRNIGTGVKYVFHCMCWIYTKKGQKSVRKTIERFEPRGISNKF